MRRALVAIVLLLALVACGRDAREEQKRKDADLPAPQSVEELKARVRAILAEEHIPGAGIALVTSDGVEWAGGVGKADVAKGTDVTADTMFRVGSITKCFVALAMVRLAEEKKIALDARLAEIAPEIAFTNPWESTRPVTVAMMLEHTAGFDDFRPPEYVASRDDVPLRDVLAVDPRSRVSRWPPGTRHSYSNPGYTIAGYVIEKVTGRPYEDHIKETLLLPLGMTRADLRRTPEVDARLAQGYVDAVPTPVPYIAIQHRPAGHLHASAAELAHLVELWLGRNLGGKEIVSQQTIAAMQKPRTLPPSALGVGYGFASYAALVNGYVAHGHNGGLDGFLSEAMYIPERGVGWVFLVNTSSPGNGMERLRKVIVRYLTRSKPAPEYPTGTLAPEMLAQYTGYYEHANSRIEILRGFDQLFGGVTVLAKNGQLWERSFLSPAKRLVPTGAEGGFRGEDEGTTRVVFTERDGANVMLAGTRYYVKTSPWKIRALRGVVFAGFALMASSILYALVWGPRWIFRKRFRVRARPIAVRVAPLVASIVGFASVGLYLTMTGIRHFVPLVNVRTVAAFVLPLVFVATSGVALGVSIRSIVRRDELRPAVKIHALLVALGSCAIVVWLAYWRWIGLRLWDW